MNGRRTKPERNLLKEREEKTGNKKAQKSPNKFDRGGIGRVPASFSAGGVGAVGCTVVMVAPILDPPRTKKLLKNKKNE